MDQCPRPQSTPLFPTLSLTKTQAYVLRLAFVPDGGVPMRVVDAWPLRPKGVAEHERALRTLRALAIAGRVAGGDGAADDGEAMFDMNPVFRGQLQVAIAGKASTPWMTPAGRAGEAGGGGGGSGSGSGDPTPIPTVDELDAWSEEHWENILHFMLGDSKTVPSPNVVSNLLSLGVLEVWTVVSW